MGGDLPGEDWKTLIEIESSLKDLLGIPVLGSRTDRTSPRGWWEGWWAYQEDFGNSYSRKTGLRSGGVCVPWLAPEARWRGVLKLRGWLTGFHRCPGVCPGASRGKTPVPGSSLCSSVLEPGLPWLRTESSAARNGGSLDPKRRLSRLGAVLTGARTGSASERAFLQPNSHSPHPITCCLL